MWYNQRTLTGRPLSTIRILLAILTSPLLLGWALLARRNDWHLISLAYCYMFSPLAIGWLWLTRRELCIQVGAFSYTIRPTPGSHIHFTNFIEKTPHYHLGSIEVLLTHQFARNKRTTTYGRVTLRWRSRCPEHEFDLHRIGQGHRVSIGPVQISGWHCPS